MSDCKNLNKSEGRETILTEEHDCGMPASTSAPPPLSPLLNVKTSQGETGGGRTGTAEAVGRGETILLTSSMRRSSGSPFSQRLRCTQFSTFE